MHTYNIKSKTHEERWMIYVFIYAIYFFRYRCKPTFSPKKNKKGIKTETYKVKIIFWAHYLKVTFGFQKHKLKSTTASSPLSPSPPTTNKTIFFKGFSCNKGICDELMVTPDKFTNEAEGQLGLFQHAHTTELKAPGFPIADLQTP